MVIRGGVRQMKKQNRQSGWRGIAKRMLLLAASLMLISHSGGCAPRSSCPEFPIPPPEVQAKFDKLAEEDRQVWEWGNKLLDLCQQLGTCEEDDPD